MYDIIGDILDMLLRLKSYATTGCTIEVCFDFAAGCCTNAI